jgi:uncharacterized protein with GYD domain
MAINIVLGNFTDQGIKNIKDSLQRAKAFRDLAKKHGCTVRDLYWTLGQYDLVTIVEGNEEALLALGLSVGRLGNVRTQSLRGFDADTMQRVLEKVT